MKTLPMSRSAESRNARKDMVIRSRAGTSRSALLAPDQVLTGRRFGRANRLTHDEAVALKGLVRGPKGSIARPTLHVTIDDLTRMITGWHVS